MNRHETNKQNMNHTVTAVFSSKRALETSHPALWESYLRFRAKVDEIDATDKRFITSIGGKTETKNLLEDELIDEVMPVKAGLFAYAIKNRNEELKALTADSEAVLKKMRDPEFLKKAQLIKAEAEKVITELTAYNITAALLTELQTKIDAFAAALNGKDTSFTNRSALRKTLTEKFEEADFILEHELDTLIEMTRKSDTHFYNQYFAARVIKDLGTARKEDDKPVEPTQPK